MKLTVRNTKLNAAKYQLLSSLELQAEGVTLASTKYSGIALLDIDQSSISPLSEVRNVEVLLINEVFAGEVHSPMLASKTPALKSLDGVDAIE